jgi:hypothetical protein
MVGLVNDPRAATLSLANHTTWCIEMGTCHDCQDRALSWTVVVEQIDAWSPTSMDVSTKWLTTQDNALETRHFIRMECISHGRHHDNPVDVE